MKKNNIRLKKKQIAQLNKTIPKIYKKSMAIIINYNEIDTQYILYYKGNKVFCIDSIDDKVNTINLYGFQKEYNSILFEILDKLIDFGYTGIIKY